MGFDTLIALQLITLVVLIAASGFFSGSETALTSLGNLRAKRIITDLKSQGETRFRRRLQYWIDNSQDMLIMILVGNNVVNISASALATVVATELLRIIGIQNSLALGGSLAVGVMTFVILICGEITPKSYAKANPETFARRSLPPLIFLTRISYPAIALLRGFTWFLIKIIGGKLPGRKRSITEEELKSLVLAGRQEGTLEESELEMLYSVFEFDETVVREIMIPRTDVRALEVDTPFEEVIDLAVDTGYSRIPVYEEKLDQIVGILNIKDLLIRTHPDRTEQTELEDLVRPAYFVPESKKVNQLLREFRRNQVHMAIVVDEYGGTSGLITMEDILEQIVGEIHDEYDEERDWVLKIQENTFLVDARIDLDDLVDRIDYKLPTEEYDSLGGLIVESTGKIPEEGEEIHLDDMKLVVVSADQKRVKKVRLILDASDDSPDETQSDEDAQEAIGEDVSSA